MRRRSDPYLITLWLVWMTAILCGGWFLIEKVDLALKPAHCFDGVKAENKQTGI